MNADMIYLDGEHARDIPRVIVPEDWAQTMKTARRSDWNEIHGHGYGQAEIKCGSELERKAQTVFLAGLDSQTSLIWVEGHDGTLLGFIEKVPGGYRFCG